MKWVWNLYKNLAAWLLVIVAVLYCFRDKDDGMPNELNPKALKQLQTLAEHPEWRKACMMRLVYDSIYPKDRVLAGRSLAKKACRQLKAVYGFEGAYELLKEIASVMEVTFPSQTFNLS